MEKDKLKLYLLEKIIACEDAAVLLKIQELLKDFTNLVGDIDEKYASEVDPVPQSVYHELEEEWKRYQKNSVEGLSWEDFRKETKSKHGF